MWQFALVVGLTLVALYAVDRLAPRRLPTASPLATSPRRGYDHRLSIDITDVVLSNLRRVSRLREIEPPDEVEVIRRALAVYCFLADRVADGYTIVLERPNSQSEELDFR